MYAIHCYLAKQEESFSSATLPSFPNEDIVPNFFTGSLNEVGR